MSDDDYTIADEFELERRFGFVCDKLLTDNEIRIVHLRHVGSDFICMKCEYTTTDHKPCVWTVQPDLWAEPHRINRFAINCADPISAILLIYCE